MQKNLSAAVATICKLTLLKKFTVLHLTLIVDVEVASQLSLKNLQVCLWSFNPPALAR